MGHLLTGPGFSLLDAISCIQLGHPGMDAGILSPPGADKGISLEVKPLDSTPARLGVLQGLLVAAVGYLSGQHIGQTVYTCTLLHEDVLCPSLQAPILALLKTLALSRHLLLASHSVAEEDFVFDLMEFSLFEDVSEGLVQKELESYLFSLNSTEGLRDIVGFVLEWYSLVMDLTLEEKEYDWTLIRKRLGGMNELLCRMNTSQNFFETDGRGIFIGLPDD